MTEHEWLASDDPAAMLRTARREHETGTSNVAKVSARKLRLFACACVRLAWHMLADNRSREAVEVAERYADGEATEEEREAADRAALDVSPRDRAAISANYALWPTRFSGPIYGANRILSDFPENAQAQANLLRCIVGNPFRPVTLSGEQRHEWVCLSPTVLAVAQAAYEEWGGVVSGVGMIDPARLAILADALEEAGCDNADLLAHLRGFRPCLICLKWVQARPQPAHQINCHGEGCDGFGRRPLSGPHALGCWALDLVLGKA